MADWFSIQKHNKSKSAAKARREITKNKRKAYVASKGGPVKIDEIKTASRREIPSPYTILPISCVVWHFRDADWVICSIGLCDPVAFPIGYPGYQPDPDTGVPLTPAALAWYQEQHPED